MDQNSKKLYNIYKKVAEENNLTIEEVKVINESQFKFIREKIRSINFKLMNEDNWKEFKTNFNLKYLGKLYINPYTVFKNNNKKKNGTT